MLKTSHAPKVRYWHWILARLQTVAHWETDKESFRLRIGIVLEPSIGLVFDMVTSIRFTTHDRTIDR